MTCPMRPQERALTAPSCRVCRLSRCAVHNSTASGPQRPADRRGHDQLRSMAPSNRVSKGREKLPATGCNRRLAGSKRRGSMPAELKKPGVLEGELRLFRPLRAPAQGTCSRTSNVVLGAPRIQRKRALRRSAGALVDAPRLSSANTARRTCTAHHAGAIPPVLSGKRT